MRSFRHGARTMRIAATRRTAPLFPRSVSGREQAPVHTRPVAVAGLPTRPLPTACFSEPEGVLPTSAFVARYGHPPRASIDSSCCIEGGRALRCLRLRHTPCGVALADEPFRDRSRREERFARLSTGESPSRTDSAHLVRREQAAGETERSPTACSPESSLSRGWREGERS